MAGLSDLHVRGIRGGVWSTGNAIASAALAFLKFVALSRILGPESFGLMAMINASLALDQTLLATSFAEALIQIPRLRSGHKDTLFWTLQALSGGLVLAAILLRGEVERYFVQEGLGRLLAATSFILYLRATAAVPRALLVRDLRFAAMAQATVTSELAGGAWSSSNLPLQRSRRSSCGGSRIGVPASAGPAAALTNCGDSAPAAAS